MALFLSAAFIIFLSWSKNTGKFSNQIQAKSLKFYPKFHIDQEKFITSV
jgi:hypothetical protein